MIIALAISTALSAVPLVFAQGQKAAGHKPTVLPIKNDRFAASDSPKQPITDWTFEPITVEIDDSDWRVKIGAKGGATASVTADGPGVLLQSTGDLARGDLISAPLHIKPFRWVKVGVEYTIESGEPLLFTCLRPTQDRSLVDLEFLPKTAPGEKRRAFVMLHTGALDGDYSVSISIAGTGSARIFILKAREEGEYPRPTKPALVVDLMHDPPVTNGPYAWEDVEKLVKVNGFPSVEYVSYARLSEDKLESIDPGLVLLSAFVDRTQNPDRRKIMQATQTVIRSNRPLLGVGMGHQIIARVQNAPEMDRVPEFGPTRLQVVAEDPAFAGLPRPPYFYASESHNGIVRDVPPQAEVIATSERVLTQAFRYTGGRCYTFQANIESGWEHACPEACLVWKNLLRQWGLAPPAQQ
jgi:GMP synthase-like glutamine amidotransferase